MTDKDRSKETPDERKTTQAQPPVEAARQKPPSDGEAIAEIGDAVGGPA